MGAKFHDDVIICKYFRITGLWVGYSPVTGEFPSKGQWRGALMFPLINAWTNGWTNNRDAGNLRRHRVHYDVTVMYLEDRFDSIFPSCKISVAKNKTAWGELKIASLQWLHNGRDGISNHWPHDCVLYRLFRRIPKKTSKPHVTGLCAGNSLVTGEFPAQRASSAENASIWWRYHDARVFQTSQLISVTPER